LNRVEAKFDEFEQRTSFEEGYWILDGSVCSRRKVEPREGEEVKITKACTEPMLLNFGRSMFPVMAIPSYLGYVTRTPSI